MTIEQTGFEPETPTDLPETDTAPDAGVAGDEGGEDQATVNEDENAAFLAGIEKHNENPKDDPDYVPGLKDIAPKDPAATAADTAAAAAAKKEPGAKTADPKPEGEKDDDTDDKKAAKAKIAEEVTAEAAELKLKPGSAAETRFREMSTKIKEQAPVFEALTKAGISDPAKIDEVMQAAARGIEWEETVLASTATPQQFGEMMGIIQKINSGDPVARNEIFDHLMGVVGTLGKELGRSIPGISDPLEDHQDLKDMVERMDITPEAAAEIAQHRATQKATQANSERQHQQQDQQTATQQGINQAIQFENEMRTKDPHYAAKFQALLPTISVIKENVHPSKWAEQIASAYAKIPNPAPVPAAAPAPAAPARVRVSHIPARSGVTAGATVAKAPANETEAFLMGVDSVSQH